jgi:S-DNA-T family DNA segregation ATPase FtsK/SpoIIIE
VKRHRKKHFKFAISSKVTLTVFGIFLGGAGVVLLLSFLHFLSGGDSSGRFLSLTNQYLMENFGGISFGLPFLFFLLAGHCFNSKKFTLIHWHTSTGTFFFLLGSLGLFAAGSLGLALQTTLFEGFTALGGRLIFIILLTVGVVLFFDVEPQMIVSAVLAFIKSLTTMTQVPEEAKLKDEFIKDKKTVLGKDLHPKVDKQPTIDEFISDGKQDKNKGQKVDPAMLAKKPIRPPDTMTVNPISQSQKMMWIHPPLELLQDITSPADRGDTQANAAIIENTLRSFGIKARVAEVNPGPTVTQYALEVAVGTNISEIVKKSSNLALALASTTGTVRIEAPIPGRSLVGIEIPNRKAELVTIKRLLQSKVFKESSDPLLVPLGLDVAGEALAVSLDKMPHVLIAGTTGSGKSVMVNAWITTMLLRAKPSDLRLVLVDPKQVELTGYNGIPHLLTEVITDPSKVVNALRWAVAEMETRYKMLRHAGVKNIQTYNQIPNIEKKPYVVFIIDELADLMMVAKPDIEGLIVRIAQKARAVGIHLVLATQRPSVNVITGLMKANIPTRLAFNVASGVDSKVILDTVGAENLVGRGDMFYSAPDTPRPKRIQGPFVSEKELTAVVGFIRQNNPLVQYTEEVTETPKDEFVGGNGGANDGEEHDPFFNQAIDLIRGVDKASSSLFQRRFKVGYARAARILDELESAGFVGPADGSKPRTVLIKANTAASDTESVEGF